MKKIFPFLLIIFYCTTAFAQKQSFDVVSFTVPKGWQQKQNEGSVQLLATDKKTNAYIMAIITNASPSNATAIENFNSKWKAAIKDQIQLDGEPTMQPSSNDNGWDIETGSAIYTDNGAKGNVALLSATGGGQTVSVVIMYNSNQYEKELTDFLNSLELAKPTASLPNNASNSSKASIVGLWCDNHLEISGYYNGYAQYTAGYFRREYNFRADGTYIYRAKNWSTLLNEILFVYEIGTYTVNGNQLTIIPTQGKGGWWGKKDNNTKLWGAFIKASSFKLEKITYTFGINYYSGIKEHGLYLKTVNNTERDGTTGPNGFSFKLYDDGISIIDNPPGFKADAENKSVSATNTKTAQPAISNNNANASNPAVNQLAGIWGQYQNEANTSGYDWREYYFNQDGTYQFLQKNISYLYHNDIIYAYEKGTYQLNGNQLTLSPQSGTVESWTKAGSDKAGKLIKTDKRILEKISYTFTLQYFSGIQKTNLVLQYPTTTQRDGAFSNNNTYKNAWLYSRPFNPNKPSIELPAGTKINFRY